MLTSDSDSDLELIDGLRPRKQRKFNETVNYLQTLDDLSFHQRFRLTKQTFRFLCNKIRDKIAPATAR